MIVENGRDMVIAISGDEHSLSAIYTGDVTTLITKQFIHNKPGKTIIINKAYPSMGFIEKYVYRVSHTVVQFVSVDEWLSSHYKTKDTFRKNVFPGKKDDFINSYPISVIELGN